MNLFFLSNWQTMMLNVADLMLYFLRQRDELEACDVYATRLIARGDVYGRAMSMLVRCLCPEGWLLVARISGRYVFMSSIVLNKDLEVHT